jgi:NADP-dependent 3-hydroxy acid dehydrogenase YdfG
MSNAVRQPRHVLITGASSGLGAALAETYAARGVRLSLGGRNAERLETVAERCRKAGAVAAPHVLDVDDRAPVADWIAGAEAAAPLDLVIANAGVSAGTGSGGESDEQARAIFATNLAGALNTLQPAIAAMQPRRRGQLAVISSLAAFRGFPGAPAYCGSKAAVRVWAESMRPHLAAQGLGITVVCPGFVRSRMTAVNAFPMPMLMEADKAAHLIRRRLARDPARISFPAPLAAAVWLLAALPPGWTDRLMRRLPEKG